MDELGKAYNIPKKDKTGEAEMAAKAQEVKDKLTALAQSQ